MIPSSRFLLLLAIFLLAKDSFAQNPCIDEVVFGGDGSVSEWLLCQRKKQLVVGGGHHGLLQINVSTSIDQSNVDLIWRYQPAADGKYVFIGTDEQHTFEIIRTYSHLSTFELSHALSIKNLSDHSLSGLTLFIRVDTSPRSDVGALRKVADYLYEFKSVFGSTKTGRWIRAGIGDSADGFAVLSRHKVVVFQTGIEAELYAGPEEEGESDSIERLDAFVVALQIAPLGSQSSRDFHQSVSAFSSQVRILDGAGYADLMYSDLWSPLGALCPWIESFLSHVSNVFGGLGAAIVLLAVAIRLITYPITRWAAQKQLRYARIAEVMKPIIADIRSKYTGAEQSERILAVYRANDINPFSSLLGSIGFFVQVPFLLAVFNITTASSLFEGESLFWISDLSQADSVIILPLYLPFLGNSINLLPLLLGVVNVVFADTVMSGSVSGRWTSIITSLVIVLIFYSFSSALVLYWLAVNVIQVGERRILPKLKLLFSHRSGIAL